MTDIVPYQPGDLALPESPSPNWRIVKMEPAHQTGRWHKNSYQVMNIVLEHTQPNGEIVTVEVMVDRAWKLVNLVPFLEAAENLPNQMRIKVYVAEKVPWDRRPGRHP